MFANMIGVRRETVTETGFKRQRVGLISFARGRMSVGRQPGHGAVRPEINGARRSRVRSQDYRESVGAMPLPKRQ